MYIQWFVKGIASVSPTGSPLLDKAGAIKLIAGGHGLLSNWWRNHPLGRITPSEVQAVLTERNLDRHVHDYDAFGPETPFISVASGCIERDTLLQRNHAHSARDVALDFATDSWAHPGSLFYGWLPAALNPAVEVGMVGEAIRDLNVYHRWSPFQLEGEVTAKVHIPANQIRLVEWWDPGLDRDRPSASYLNTGFVAPTSLLNERHHF